MANFFRWAPLAPLPLQLLLAPTPPLLLPLLQVRRRLVEIASRAEAEASQDLSEPLV